LRKGATVLVLFLAVAIMVAARLSFVLDGASGQTPAKGPSRPRAQEFPELLHKEIAPLQLEQLGKAIFFDKNLSNPPGLACASCHSTEAGYAGSGSSKTNATLGIVPGAVPGRFENRNPPTIAYAKFCPKGPPSLDQKLGLYIGGLFLDGRAPDLKTQVHRPFLHPNEMNNVINNVPAPQLVVKKIQSGKYAKAFQDAFGADAFNKPIEGVFDSIAEAVVAFESSREVSLFSSKYDAFVAGKVKLTASELNGLRLVTGSETGRPGGPAAYKNAQCVLCHTISSDQTKGPDLWSQFSYANVGVPRNPKNPYYLETDKSKNPLGYNLLGSSYVDLGLGDFLYAAKGLPPGNLGSGSNGEGDFLAINGTFKVPTLRNTDKRPNPTFVKAYMHNGAFKSLQDVVHFYNTRNLTSSPGEVINFNDSTPYRALKGKPLWPSPEYLSPVTLQNPAGLPGLVGNLGLIKAEEDDIVAFLKTLSDGYFKP
jgi:cytochrome c peroxidase